jgi:hypothetical protein
MHNYVVEEMNVHNRKSGAISLDSNKWNTLSVRQHREVITTPEEGIKLWDKSHQFASKEFPTKTSFGQRNTVCESGESRSRV